MSEPIVRPRLLIVEPDDSVRRVLGRWLHRRFEVAPVGRGAAAVGRLREERFDVVIVDLGVGDVSALVVAAARDCAPALPVVVTSASLDLELETAARALGASAFVTKPFDAAALMAALTKAMG
jgi:two-component system KDP operon response regulator KdpE